MTWDEYYEGFWGWAESTRISRLSTLSDFGSSDEVCEIAINFYDEKIATRLIRKALEYGVKFTTDEIIELRYSVSEKIYSELVYANSNPYTYEKLDELYGFVDDIIIERLANKYKIKAPEEEQEVENVKKSDFGEHCLLCLVQCQQMNFRIRRIMADVMVTAQTVPRIMGTDMADGITVITM